MLAVAHSITTKICSADGCERGVDSRGLCLMHYKRAIKSGAIVAAKRPEYHATCIVDECDKPSEKRGLCQMHYRRMQRTGHLGRTRREVGSEQPRSDGYIDQTADGERKLQHVLLSEKALGKPLPAGAEVHHVNEIRSDNRPENLVVCQDRSYHQLLHARQRAFDECGHASWRKCIHCKQYDDPANMSGGAKGKALNAFYHKPCAARYVRERKAIRKSRQS